MDDTIHKGWLVKSPPEKKIQGTWKLGRFFQPKWRRRYFVLHVPPASSSIPGQYRLDYYDNANLRKHIGFIDLDQCEWIQDRLDTVHYKHLFALQTKHKGHDRKYFLAADSEEDMNRWVQCLCRVCNLRPDSSDEEASSSQGGSSQASMTVADPLAQPVGSTPPVLRPLSNSPRTHTAHPSTPGRGPRKNSTPYIPLEECFSEPQPQLLDQVPPAPSGRRSSAHSIDSIPDEAPPPPPSKLGDQSRTVVPSDDWDPNQTYDHPRHNYTNLPDEDDVYNVPRRQPVPNRDMSDIPPSCHMEFKPQSEDWYQVPPGRQVVESLYNTPRPQPHNKTQRDSGSSNGSHTSQSKQDSAYESGDTYDYPKRLTQDDVYDTLPRRAQLSSNVLMDTVPPPPRPHKTPSPQPPDERLLPYENLPVNSKSHPSYNMPPQDIYDVPPHKPHDIALLAMSPPPPKPCSVSPQDHSYVNDPKTGPTTDSMYMPMQSCDENYMPMQGGGALGYDPHDPEIYTHMAGGESIYVAPPSNRPVGVQPGRFQQNPNPGTRPSRVQRLAPSIPTPTDENADTYGIFSTQRTRSFKRTANPNRPDIPLPTKRGERNSSSSDDDSGSLTSHDCSLDGSTLGTSPSHRTSLQQSLHNTPPPPHKRAGEVQYLDLDLDESSDAERSPVFPRSPPPGNGSPTDYKEIDFIKTKALSETKRQVEQENRRKSSEKSVDE